MQPLSVVWLSPSPPSVSRSPRGRSAGLSSSRQRSLPPSRSRTTKTVIRPCQRPLSGRQMYIYDTDKRKGRFGITAIIEQINKLPWHLIRLRLRMLRPLLCLQWYYTGLKNYSIGCWRNGYPCCKSERISAYPIKLVRLSNVPIRYVVQGDP